MNRTDRLLAIVLELQAHRRRRAADLASTFETSKRTIYRDIQALSEAGVPIVAAPGRGYALQEGYFLPPLSFSADEAMLLLLGADFLARQFDAQYRAAAEVAGRKIAAALPEARRAEVEALRGGIGFITPDAPGNPAVPDLLRRLRGAILARTTVRFTYHARYQARAPAPETPGEQHRARQADPYAIAQVAGAWYLVAYCHRRRAIRTFRFDRIADLETLPATFTRPADFRIGRRDGDDDRPIVVRALFDRAVARWVREAPSYFQVGAEERPDGLLVTLAVRREEEVLNWLLGWGGGVRVLEPASLRRRLVDEAAAILRRHGADGDGG